jgi:hypothetical protein
MSQQNEPGLVEYVLIVILVIVVTMVVLAFMGEDLVRLLCETESPMWLCPGG